MKLQDYIRHYIGCKCVHTWFPEGHKEYNKGWVLSGYCQLYDNGGKPFLLESENEVTWADSIKPILRKLEDITDDEIKELIGWEELNKKYDHVSFEHNKVGIIVNYSIPDREGGGYPMSHYIRFYQLDGFQFDFLIKKGFDMFNLIISELAIDSKTLK